MARIDNLTNFLTDVSTAIKTKGGTSSPIPASEFDTAITNLPGADIDWVALGYTTTPQVLLDGYAYAKQIKDNWTTPTAMWSTYYNDRNLMFFPMVDTSKVEYFNGTFNNCSKLIYVPQIDTSSATDMSSMFVSCPALTSVPTLDTSKVTSMYMMFTTDYSLKSIGNFDTHSVTNFYRTFYNCTSLENVPVLNLSSATTIGDMFYGCSKLTDQSLDNVLQSCITATSYTGAKRLNVLGFNASRVPYEKVISLPHYQDFVDAGWEVGYY